MNAAFYCIAADFCWGVCHQGRNRCEGDFKLTTLSLAVSNIASCRRSGFWYPQRFQAASIRSTAVRRAPAALSVTGGNRVARSSKPDRWYWPEIGNLADAEQASNQGFWAALVCAVVTALFATIAVASGSAVIGVGPVAFADAVVFAVIAWRTRARSKSFAVIGLALFVIEKIFQLATQPMSLSFGILVAVALLFAFINGVRGTFAYHRMKEAQLSEQGAAQDA